MSHDHHQSAQNRSEPVPPCSYTTYGVDVCCNMRGYERVRRSLLGHYGLGPWTPDGCLPCYCSGHSTDCESAPGWYDASVSSQWDLLDGLSEADQQWTAVDQDGRQVTVDNPTLIDATDAR